MSGALRNFMRRSKSWLYPAIGVLIGFAWAQIEDTVRGSVRVAKADIIAMVLLFVVGCVLTVLGLVHVWRQGKREAWEAERQEAEDRRRLEE